MLRDAQAHRGRLPQIDRANAAPLLAEVPAWRWEVGAGGAQLLRSLAFESFRALIAFVNQLADLAEAEDHHPDFTVSYRRLDLTLTTHDAGGVTRNDFILAAKIDALASQRLEGRSAPSGG